MKVIHCADLHLDSRLNSNFACKEKAKERRNELIMNFSDLVSFAKSNDVSHIMIAGDLFDKSDISATARNTVLHEIVSNPEIGFFYLKGNHDADNFLSDLDTLPDNLFLFNDEWTKYTLDEEGIICLYATELTKERAGSLQESFVPDPSQINIVMLHGQEANSSVKDKTEIINKNAFRNKGIDYLALGHVHKYIREELDPRCVLCYPGCLEGRGFDETGEHGFVLLDIDVSSHRIKDTFVPFAKRKLYEIEVNVEDLSLPTQMVQSVKSAIESSPAKDTDLIKVVLKGGLSVDVSVDLNFILNYIVSDFYFVKIYDETTVKVRYEDYLLDQSLKGEFVRKVSESDLSEEEKARIIRYGLIVIGGGKLEDAADFM